MSWASAHLGPEHPCCTAAGTLGRVHRDVGVAEEALHGVGGVRHRSGADGEPDRRPHLVLHAFDVHDDVDAVEESFRDRRRVDRVVDVLDEDRELVPTESGDGLAGFEGAGQLIGHGPEHPVASMVAMASLIALNPSRSTMASPARAPETPERRNVTDTIGEERPVREPGQRIVERLVAQLGLERRPIGDVRGC